jgi:hypothetical protein
MRSRIGKESSEGGSFYSSSSVTSEVGNNNPTQSYSNDWKNKNTCIAISTGMNLYGSPYCGYGLPCRNRLRYKLCVTLFIVSYVSQIKKFISSVKEIKTDIGL